MFETISRLLLYAVAVLITAYIIPGVHLESFWVAIVVAVVLSALNGFLKPVLIILTIPVTVFTMGLFLLVLNALMVILAGAIVPGFVVDGFWWALLFSIILSFFTILFGANSSQSDAF